MQACFRSHERRVGDVKGVIETAHRFTVAQQSKDVAAPPSQVGAVKEDAHHVRIAVVRARRDGRHGGFKSLPTIVRHARNVGAHLRFSGVQPCSESERSALAQGPLGIANQLHSECWPACLTQHVRLLCHGVREVHRSLCVTCCPLRRLVVPPGAFHRPRVDRLPGRQCRRSGKRKGYRPTCARQHREIQRVLKAGKVARHLVDKAGRSHFTIHGAQQLGLVVERLHHGLTNAAG